MVGHANCWRGAIDYACCALLLVVVWYLAPAHVWVHPLFCLDCYDPEWVPCLCWLGGVAAIASRAVSMQYALYETLLLGQRFMRNIDGVRVVSAWHVHG